MQKFKEAKNKYNIENTILNIYFTMENIYIFPLKKYFVTVFLKKNECCNREHANSEGAALVLECCKSSFGTL